MFFSFDGIDGAGKSTQIDLFCQWLAAAGHEVVRCQDPGSTDLGETIRKILLEGKATPICRVSEMLLFMAARAQLVDEVIRPALAQGKVVVSDRYLLANVVYQGHAGGLDVESIREIGRVATGGVEPDLTFVLDLPVEVAAARLARPPDRMESQGEGFLSRLRQGYLAEAVRRPDSIELVDADRPIDPVQADIRRHAERLLHPARS